MDYDYQSSESPVFEMRRHISALREVKSEALDETARAIENIYLILDSMDENIQKLCEAVSKR